MNLSPINRRLTFAFALVAALLVANALLLGQSAHRLIQIRDAHVDTYEMLSELRATLSTMKDAEAGQRTYLLTGDDSYIQRLEQTERCVSQHLSRLRSLVPSSDRRRLEQLEASITYTLTEFKRTTDLRRIKGFDAAMRSVVYGPGRYKIEDIEQVTRDTERSIHVQLAEQVEEARITTRRTILTFAVATLAGFVLLWFLHRRLDRYVRELDRAEAALRISEDNLRQSQKLEAVGRLAGGIAHDFNNLLTVINGYSQLLLRRDGLSHSKEIQQIKEAGDRGAALVRQLLAFSRRQVLQKKILDLNAVVTGINAMLQRLIGADIRLSLALQAQGAIQADAGQIDQVLMNLAANARDAMPGGGNLLIETIDINLDPDCPGWRVGMQSGPHILLAVSDTGCGMDAATQAKIFEPFFTTKEQGQGTGLGLSTVYGIVKQSGGCIAVYSEVGRGTTFKIYLPSIGAQPSALAASQAAVAEAGGLETILLLEDDPSIRMLVRSLLRRLGYTVLESASMEEAVSVAEEHDGPIHLLLTDIVMPGGSGIEAAERLMQRYSELRVLFMSGYTDNVLLQGGQLPAGQAFLQKPFTNEDLARLIREVLTRPSKEFTDQQSRLNPNETIRP